MRFNSAKRAPTILALLTLLSAAQPASAQDVEFLSEMPEADGKLSEVEQSLARRNFAEQYRFDNPIIDAPDISYRLGFTQTHLYIAISTTASEVTYRNRGYLWGDGWRVLLGDPADGSRTATYIEVLVSPKEPGDDRLEMVIGTQDGVQVYRRLSEDSRSAEDTGSEGTVFEAMIAWEDLAPFNPVFDPRIGVNLYFAKGFSTPEVGDFPYGYAMAHDEGIWEEQIASRAIVPLEFDVEEAVLDRGATHHRLVSRSVVVGHPIEFESVTLATPAAKLQGQALLQPTASPVGASLRVSPEPTSIVSRFSLQSDSLSPGEHEIILPDDSRHTLWLFPDFAPQAARETISANDVALLSQGTRESLEFLLECYEQERTALRPYSDAGDLLETALRLVDMSAKAATGQDPFDGLIGPYRRGFRSSLDGTLQPYSIKLPEGFKKDTTYPALVFLHGSGSDERGLLDRPRANGRMIEIAPYGRDKFHAYASQASQIDIAEALDAAARDFPIDRERMVIGGFSMGGYGALRAFYENPDRYKGVAVFAGHPNLANEWLGDTGYPDFLDQKFLSPFRGVPVFIYHGQKDGALPYDLAVKLAEALRAAGADVTFSGPAEMGHTYQDPATHAMYVQWLEQF